MERKISIDRIIEFYPYRKAKASSAISVKVNDEDFKYLTRKIEECPKECIEQYREFYRNTYHPSMSKEVFDQKWPYVKPRIDNHICFVVYNRGQPVNMMYSDGKLYLGGALVIGEW